MKRIVLAILVIVFFASCKKDKSNEGNASIHVVVYKKSDPTQSNYRNNRINATIQIWKETDNSLEINSFENAKNGLAVNSNTNASVKADFSASNGDFLIKGLNAGNYLVFVIDTETQTLGKSAWSFKHVTISHDENLELYKVFGYANMSYTFESWGLYSL